MSSPASPPPRALVRAPGSHRPHWLTGLAIAIAHHLPATLRLGARSRHHGVERLRHAFARTSSAPTRWGRGQARVTRARISSRRRRRRHARRRRDAPAARPRASCFRGLDPFVMRVMDGLMFSHPSILLAVALIAIVRAVADDR